jgi:hypothetical protein
MAMPGMVVTVMRVNLWMLGVPSLRWSGSWGSFMVVRVVVLMVFHVTLSCPWKCLSNEQLKDHAAALEDFQPRIAVWEPLTGNLWVRMRDFPLDSPIRDQPHERDWRIY